MRLLLDTHFVIELIDRRLSPERDAAHAAIASSESVVFVSVASLWEASIKHGLGKLPVRIPVKEWPMLLAALEIPLLPIDENHVLTAIGDEPETRDAFDRLLLGVCAAEDIELVTRDRALAVHTLAWRDVPLVKK